ncbi:hypothetical protein GQ53DRAFT_749051 [Thozetella sp. PMI_491]|nr:hypothetical protein GQ53DRAFT_749051 [Thozetella sp. PMI_491]
MKRGFASFGRSLGPLAGASRVCQAAPISNGPRPRPIQYPGGHPPPSTTVHHRRSRGEALRRFVPPSLARPFPPHPGSNS